MKLTLVPDREIKKSVPQSNVIPTAVCEVLHRIIQFPLLLVKEFQNQQQVEMRTKEDSLAIYVTSFARKAILAETCFCCRG